MKTETIYPFLIAALIGACAIDAKADGMPTDIPNQMLIEPFVPNGCEPRVNPGWPDSTGRVQLPMVPKKAFKEVREPNTLLAILSALAVFFIYMLVDWAVHRNDKSK